MGTSVNNDNFKVYGETVAKFSLYHLSEIKLPKIA